MYWIISQVKGLAFPVQYRAAKVGPPVQYQSKICGYWCVLAVLYCQSSPALQTHVRYDRPMHMQKSKMKEKEMEGTKAWSVNTTINFKEERPKAISYMM